MRKFTKAFLLLFLSGLLILSSCNNNNNKIPELTLVLGEETQTADYTDYFIGGVLYADFSYIAEICSFKETGGLTERKYSFTDKNGNIESVKFTFGSSECIVNGSLKVIMNSPAIKDGDIVKVPADFIIKYISGITVNYDESKNELTVKRDRKEGLTADQIVFADIFLRTELIPPPVTETETTDAQIGPVVTEPAEPVFLADLSEYEKYMNPPDRDAYLLLVNKSNMLAASYNPTDLIDVANTRKDGRAMQKMREAAAKSLEALFLEAAANGIKDVSVTSAYRDYYTQRYLFYDVYVPQEMNTGLSYDDAVKAVMEYSALPGTSEHQTGLACDMHNITTGADLSFADTASYKWFKENCFKFGFIIRYPEGKTEITGYTFEPWHYRFVGRYHATKMHELNMCLEEYMTYLAEN